MSESFKHHYSWDEVEGLWEKRYEFLSKKVGIPVEKIRECRIQLLVVLGLEWVKKDYEGRSPSEGIPRYINSDLIQVLTNPIENSVFPIVELATYLKEFSKDPNFKLVVSMLKDRQAFEATRLSLAVAYRLSKVGFTKITLEPDIPKGKGDVHCKYENQKFLIECSILENPKLSNYFRERLFVRLQKSIKDGALEVGIEVSFSQAPSIQQIDETIEEIRKARHKFGKFDQNPNLEPVVFKSSVAEGRVFKLRDEDKTIPPAQEILNKWDAIFGVDLAQMQEKDNVYSTDIDNAKVQGRLFIEGLEILDSLEPFYQRVKARIEAKLTQTHGIEASTKRVFVIMTESRVETFNYSKIWDKIRPAFKNRPNVAGMFFVCRWQSDLEGKMRYAYPLILFENSHYPPAELNEVFPRLSKFERSDWIND